MCRKADVRCWLYFGSAPSNQIARVSILSVFKNLCFYISNLFPFSSLILTHSKDYCLSVPPSLFPRAGVNNQCEMSPGYLLGR